MAAELAMDIDEAMKNPGSVFDTPEALSASRELSPEEKRAVLLQWKDQLQQLLTAEAEGMQRTESGAAATSDFLRRLTNILSDMDAERTR